MQVAIKSIKKEKIKDEQDMVHIRREIEIMSSLRHPHIISIYEGWLCLNSFFGMLFFLFVCVCCFVCAMIETFTVKMFLLDLHC